MKTIFTIAVFAVFCTAATSRAQLVDDDAAGVAPTVAVSGYYGSGFFPGWGFGGGTVEGNFLQGTADLVRTNGDNAFLNSLANINNQVAVKKNTVNRDPWVETYFHMRRTNEVYRASRRQVPTSLGQAEQKAKLLVPQRLNSYQLEPFIGKINWPAGLKRSQLASARRLLEQLFAVRDAQNAGIGTAG
ncbi:MAG: hypothetical protein IT427_20620 [Pirellulales bacterium]|nr:hypothetical protein [Pirellulales bacterium]